MPTQAQSNLTHPICDRLIQLFDRRMGERKIAEFMRTQGLKAQDYHNLKRAVPGADKLAEMFKAINATNDEILYVLSVSKDDIKKNKIEQQSQNDPRLHTKIDKLDREIEFIKSYLLTNFTNQLGENEVRETSSLIRAIEKAISQQNLTEEKLKQKWEREFSADYDSEDPSFTVSWNDFCAIRNGLRQVQELGELSFITKLLDPDEKIFSVHQWGIMAQESNPLFNKVKQRENIKNGTH